MSAIFLTGASLALALAAIEPAGAANAPSVVGAATQSNPLSNSVNSGAAAAPTHWAADTSNGCKVWNPGEIANGVTARWSGRCENDFAQGPGTVRWLNGNKQMAELTGTMEQGKMRGHTTGVEEPGNRFDGMFIDSLPEGEGKANFSDGSVYSGLWHRGRQLGYGIMTFPPAHPQYQEMLKSGKGRRIENGTYEMRGWWEGKTFIFPCDSEEECEKFLVAQIKHEQEAAAAKAGAPAAPAPAATVIPAAGAVVAPAIPAPATPAAGPVATTPALPAAEPVATTPTPPVMEPAATAPATPAAEPVLAPVTPSVLPVPAAPATEPSPPAPGAPDVEPAPVPAATAPVSEVPAVAPLVVPVVVPSTSAPVNPAAEPVSDPTPPAAPDDKPAVVPETVPAT